MVRYKVFATIIFAAIAIILLPKTVNGLAVDNPQIDTVYSGLWTKVKWSDTTETTAQYNLKECQPTQLTDCNPVAIRPVTSAGSNIMVPSKSYAQWTFYVRSGDYGSFSLMNLSNRWTLQIIDSEITKINDYQFESAEVGTGGTNMVRSYRNGWRVTLTLYNPADFADYIIVEPDNSVGIWYSINAYGNIFVYTDNVIVYHSEPIDSDSLNEVNEKELEGQENIENQDTSGTNQGVGDDYSSLLDIFTGFISAISGVSATNCQISLSTDMVDFGEVDLCELNPPSWIQIVGSIIVIILFVPCSMALIKRILKTIQELQQ